MAKRHILVVDDEEDILDLVSHTFKKLGYAVTGAGDGNAALEKARRLRPDLVVLDLMLPGRDGLEVCAALKGAAETRDIAIVMLTARGGEKDVVRGLELGADDYVTKPFSPVVLAARVQAVLRRAGEAEDVGAPVEAHGIVVDPGRHEAFVNDAPVTLTPSEFQILLLLARRPGWAFTRGQIVDAIRGEGYPITDRAVDVQIVGLRKCLGESGKLIETVRGVGYRMKGVD